MTASGHKHLGKRNRPDALVAAMVVSMVRSGCRICRGSREILGDNKPSTRVARFCPTIRDPLTPHYGLGHSSPAPSECWCKQVHSYGKKETFPIIQERLVLRTDSILMDPVEMPASRSIINKISSRNSLPPNFQILQRLLTLRLHHLITVAANLN